MIPAPPFRASPWLQALQPVRSDVASFWQPENAYVHVHNIRETLDHLKAVQNELEQILLLKSSHLYNTDGADLSSGHILDNISAPSSNDSILTDVSVCSGNGMDHQFLEIVKERRISLTDMESLSLEAARSLFSTLENQLIPVSVITNQNSSWEERSLALRSAQKLQKSKRNQRWKKKKRKLASELRRKACEDYDKADQQADEWRIREIAKDIKKRKVESMKEIAKLKANEERKRLESELELVLVVEKLQELRSIRTQKLKKQGHFFPEEDDKYLERVRAAFEEEERQVAAAADTDAAKNVIAIVESQKAMPSKITEPNAVNRDSADQFNVAGGERISSVNASQESEGQKLEGQGRGGGYDSMTNLPFEFYHYYHGSNNDMGTLIEPSPWALGSAISAFQRCLGFFSCSARLGHNKQSQKNMSAYIGPGGSCVHCFSFFCLPCSIVQLL